MTKRNITRARYDICVESSLNRILYANVRFDKHDKARYKHVTNCQNNVLQSSAFGITWTKRGLVFHKNKVNNNNKHHICVGIS